MGPRMRLEAQEKDLGNLMKNEGPRREMVQP